MVDLWTVGASLGASVAASYVGVRYFTGPRIRAELAQAAKRGIRDEVSILQREIRGFRAHMRGDLKRDNGAHPDDAARAARLLQLTHDLPRFRRRVVERRLDLLFGSGWMRIVRLRDASVPEGNGDISSHALAISLLDLRHGAEGGSYTDGLLHRALVAGPDSDEARRLERQLLLLSECR
jgi:hypothetical protein